MDINKGKGKKDTPWARIVSFLVVFALLSSLAIVMKGSFFGYKVETKEQAEKEAVENTAVRISEDGELVVNTTELGKDVSGYAGPVPVEIYIRDNRIDSVRPLENSETPGFFNRVLKGGLTEAWNGKTLEEAAEIHPDAVSGATFSSKALIANVEAGIAKAAHAASQAKSGKMDFTFAQVVALIVLLCAVIIPFFYKKRPYRIIQQLLNVGVLGFWTGTFVDYTLMVNFFAHGWTTSAAALIGVILLVVAIIYPLFGQGKYYCAWVCPLGSLQELAGDCNKKKLKMSPKSIKLLQQFRVVLWVVLMCLLWAGWGAAWMDYELFTGFIVESAAWSVIGVGIAFILLSFFIPRPFCRFVCPTGTIISLSVK